MANGLIELALKGTDSSRSALLLDLCSLIVKDIDQRSDQELELFAEISLKLYEKATPSDRGRLARRLADNTRTPTPLAKRIAKDEITVAMPVLAQSPVFTQEDLLDLVENLSSAHLQVIARRTDLGTEVSDALVKRGDRPVHRIIAGNREIKLSRSALLALVREAVRDVVLREDLTLRADLTPSACKSLMPMVNETTQKRLRKIVEGGLPKEQLDQIARLRAIRRKFGPDLDNPDVDRLWQTMQAAGVAMDDLVTILLQDKRFLHVINLVARASGANAQLLKDAVYTGELETVLGAAEKAKLSSGAFTEFAKSRCEHLRIPSSKAAEWADAYALRLMPGKPVPLPRVSEFQARRKVRTDKPRVRRRLLPI